MTEQWGCWRRAVTSGGGGSRGAIALPGSFRLLPLLVLPALAAMVLTLFSPAAGAQQVAAWPEGDFQGQVAGVPLVLHLAREQERTTCSLDSPQQGAMALPCTLLSAEGSELSFRVPAANASWRGEVLDEGNTLRGMWSQGGAQLALELKRGASAPAMHRPQTPQPPFPYRSEQMRIINPAAPQVLLGGTLTLPAGEGPFPAVLLATGSGAQDRDETLFGHKPFLVIADYLTRRGIAVLRVDDRGVGDSTGASLRDTTLDYARDAAASLAWLRAHADIDATRVGMLGHSEGALIAALRASEDADLAFVVMLGGPAMPGAEVIVEQVRALSRAAGRSTAEADAAANLQQRVMQALVAAPLDPAAARAAVADVMRAAGAAVPGDAQMAQLTSPWYRHFLTLDPVPLLRAIKAPVLAIQGGRDAQVPANPNLQRMREALAGNTRAEIVEFPELNHLLQTAVTGGVQEYATIEETMAPAVLEKIAAWITAVAAQR